MAYVVREDVGTTPRRSLSGHSRLKVWERSGGVCVICGHPDRWRARSVDRRAYPALELGVRMSSTIWGPPTKPVARQNPR